MIDLPGLADRYEITGLLGQGGMGTVYRGFDRQLNREVAIKTIRDSADSQRVEMFHKEWRILASLNHPNVVEIYDVSEFGDVGAVKPYFVMPLLNGATLADLIKGVAEPLPLERVSVIIGHTCKGLFAAHSRGLVHRDLKPSNIFVLEDDFAKIIDFGVARLASGSAVLSRIAGTSAYMAPEQIRGELCTPQSDLFSLGVLCYEALAGRRPFEGGSREDLEKGILTQPPEPLCSRRPSLPQDVGRVVQKALAKRPSVRFQDVRQFADTFNKACRNEPITLFDAAQAEQRLIRAAGAFAAGNLQIAGEILDELESDGHESEEMRSMRRRIDQCVKAAAVEHLLSHAKQAFEINEFSVALRKIEEALAIAPDSVLSAELKNRVETARISHEQTVWLRLARSHLENAAFAEAQDATEQALRLNAASSDARQMAKDVAMQKDEHSRRLQQVHVLHRSALLNLEHGEIRLAELKARRLLEIDQATPSLARQHVVVEHQRLLERVVSRREELDLTTKQIQEHREKGDSAGALELCRAALGTYTRDDRLRFTESVLIEETSRTSAHRIAGIHDSIANNPDLDSKLRILAAVEGVGESESLQEARKAILIRKDLIVALAAAAGESEQRQDFLNACYYLETLKEMYPPHPDIQNHIDRVRRLEQGESGFEEGKAPAPDPLDYPVEPVAPRQTAPFVESSLPSGSDETGGKALDATELTGTFIANPTGHNEGVRRRLGTLFNGLKRVLGHTRVLAFSGVVVVLLAVYGAVRSLPVSKQAARPVDFPSSQAAAPVTAVPRDPPEASTGQLPNKSDGVPGQTGDPGTNREVVQENESRDSPSLKRRSVRIAHSDLGYVNVRDAPRMEGKILTKVHPDEIYQFTKVTSDGWYYLAGKKGAIGWVAGKYIVNP